MGRHDLTLGAALKGHLGLATGLYALTPVLTPTGWTAVRQLVSGDLVITTDHGPAPIVALRLQPRQALWSVHIPQGALGNAQAVILPPGQTIQITSPYAVPFTGETVALVPAASLEGWRGIAPHVPACSEPIVQLDLSWPALIQAGPGLIIGLDTVTKGPNDLLRLLVSAPNRHVLPFGVARHLVAALVAEETGQALRAAEFAGDQARIWPAKRA